MLDALRNSAKSWVVKVLLGLLVLSFGVWGVSGTIFQGVGSTVVSVGETRVTPIEYRLAYDRQVAIVSRQFGTRLTTEQARALGLENQVLGQVVSNAALDEQSRRMNLGLSKDRLATIIADDPAFRGINGRFDRNTFANLLRNVGMTEEDFIVSQESAAIRSQIVEAVSDGYQAPATIMKALYQFENEERTFDYIVLNRDIVGEIPDPSDTDLQTYFEANKATYRAPEYRKIAYVPLKAEDISDPAAISDASVRADYESRIDRYTTPEQRTIEQLNFADSDAAIAALGKLAGGATFDEIATEEGKSPSDIRLGTFEKSTVPDPALADAAFAIEEQGGTSDVVDGSFGPVILRVSEIMPETIRGFDEVKEEIRSELAIVEAEAILLDVHDAYEDSRAGGDTLQEAATKQKMTPVIIDAVDRAARTPNGDILTDLPESQTLLAQAFDTEINVESAPINIGSEGFLWFEVLDIIPARDQALDEVRTRVVEDWKNEQTAKALGARGTELKDRIEKGEELTAVAAEIGLATDTKYNVKRSYTDAVLGASAIEAAFTGPDGHVALAEAEGGTSQILMKVNQVSTPDAPTSGPQLDNLNTAVSRRMGDDLLGQMVALMQSEFGVSYNPTAAELALTAGY
ncbi:MAG: SurA N-terminal domain-containing protein [Alphaproteobacteria bacterium]|nr:SurA N-terminal domain-containing protein [Alphaproteobacteria bacterium]